MDLRKLLCKSLWLSALGLLIFGCKGRSHDLNDFGLYENGVYILISSSVNDLPRENSRAITLSIAEDNQLYLDYTSYGETFIYRDEMIGKRNSKRIFMPNDWTNVDQNELYLTEKTYSFRLSYGSQSFHGDFIIHKEGSSVSEPVIFQEDMSMYTVERFPD